jgi:NAD(P)H-hydrate repair Nnr-like enzyme with NAD(P)H-hydrate dehydratase domain
MQAKWPGFSISIGLRSNRLRWKPPSERLLSQTGVVVMKGADTFVVGDEIWRARFGSIALATSGSGDVLAGLLGGLLARGTDPTLAALWAVYLHGEAGRRLGLRQGSVGALAREFPDEIPRLMAGFEPAPS